MRITKKSLRPLLAVGTYPPPMSYTSWDDLLGGMTGWLLSITVSVILLCIVVGGLVYITSAGDQERMRWGKRIILAALVGFAVIILSASIIAELKGIL